jgi:hypothetical protein
LSPLPLTGATAAAMDAWMAEGVRQGEAGELARRGRTNDRGPEVVAAAGSACERTCCAQDGTEQGSERVLVGRSPVHAARQVPG